MLHIKTAIQIQRKPSEVFEAIVDPGKMKNYFISESTGRMEEGKEIIWKWPEFEVKAPIQVRSIKPNEYISYSWQMNNKDLLVEIFLEERQYGATLVTVTEKEMPNDEDGINWLKGNTAGWANFLACLKAYLEFGINLRKGSFDFMKE